MSRLRARGTAFEVNRHANRSVIIVHEIENPQLAIDLTLNGGRAHKTSVVPSALDWNLHRSSKLDDKFALQSRVRFW